MHHLYRLLHDEAKVLEANRHDVAVHHADGDKGAVGFLPICHPRMRGCTGTCESGMPRMTVCSSS